jgi:DNA gyrase subunit A
MSIRFHEDQLRDQGRDTRGVRGIRSARKTTPWKASKWSSRRTLLAITENGYGKRTRFEEYPTQKRGGKGSHHDPPRPRIPQRQGRRRASPCAISRNDALMLITPWSEAAR